MRKQLSKIEMKNVGELTLSEYSSEVHRTERRNSNRQTAKATAGPDEKMPAYEIEYRDFVYSVFALCYTMATGKSQDGNEV